MLLLSLILVPLTGILLVSFILTYNISSDNTKILKTTALSVTIVNLVISLII